MAPFDGKGVQGMMALIAMPTHLGFVTVVAGNNNAATSNRSWQSPAPLMLGPLLVVCWLCGSPTRASADEIVVLSDCVDAEGLLVGWAQALPLSKLDARYGTNSAFPPTPNPADIRRADESYQKGLDLFLAAKMNEAATAFAEAKSTYAGLLEVHPFHTPTYEAVVRASFYEAHTLRLARKKNEAREEIAVLLQTHPAAAPDPGIFPPDFTKFVDGVRSAALSGLREVTIETSPKDAMVSINGHPVEGNKASVAGGNYKLTVGLPGIGMITRQIDDETTSANVALITWPEGVEKPECGEPLPSEMVSSLSTGGALWMTDRSMVDEQGGAAFLHDSRGEVTAVFEFPPGATRPDEAAAAELARRVASARTSPDLEVFALAADGSASTSDELTAKWTDLLRDGETITPPPMPSETSITLALDLGSGMGVATEVTDPGLAPTVFFVRPDVAYAISPSLALGVAGRIQVVKFAALAEPYARFRLAFGDVRAGVVLGNITHSITDTENRKESTSGWGGVSTGLSIPISPLRLGVAVLAPLFPDPTVQVDATIGVAFDL